MTEKDKKERRRVSLVCSEMAKKILKPGDRIGCTKCPGTKRVFTFKEWDGYWMVSATGINDYSPYHIYSINGVAVDFKKDAQQQVKADSEIPNSLT